MADQTRETEQEGRKSKSCLGTARLCQQFGLLRKSYDDISTMGNSLTYKARELMASEYRSRAILMWWPKAGTHLKSPSVSENPVARAVVPLSHAPSARLTLLHTYPVFTVHSHYQITLHFMQLEQDRECIVFISHCIPSSSQRHP